jgi:hypothetical protein
MKALAGGRCRPVECAAPGWHCVFAAMLAAGRGAPNEGESVPAEPAKGRDSRESAGRQWRLSGNPGGAGTARCGRSLRAPLGLSLQLRSSWACRSKPHEFSIARSRQAVPLAGAEMGRSSLRSDCPPLLALGAHGKTRYVRCAHCAQTVAVSQKWMRAGARRPQDCAARRPMTAPARGTACRSSTTEVFVVENRPR